MTQLLHELLLATAASHPTHTALELRREQMSYASLAETIDSFAAGLLQKGLQKQERVAIYLPKQFETVIAMFGTARAGCVFVPVNPLLKPAQVEHILRDCAVRLLVTSA